MAINAKAKGSRRELQCRKILEALGYEVCKAGGSLGKWDLVAIHPTHARVIQVKSNRPPPPAEREGMVQARVPAGMSKEIWVWVDGQRLPKVEVL